MDRMVFELLKLVILLGALAMAGLWSLIGLLLYFVPPMSLGLWLGGKTVAGVVLGFLFMTAFGLSSLKWKALARVFDAFGKGNLIIIGSAERAIAEIDRERLNSPE